MAEVSSKENSSQTSTVYARNTGLFKDGYHVYYYSDEIEELATPLFQDKPFIRNYQLEVQGHTTTTEWNGKESVEEYLKKREYEIETSIYLNEGKTDEEYAEEISYNRFLQMVDDGKIEKVEIGSSQITITAKKDTEQSEHSSSIIQVLSMTIS